MRLKAIGGGVGWVLATGGLCLDVPVAQAGDHELKAISLPTSLANRLLSFDTQDEILTSLEADPDGLGAGEAIPLAIEEAPIAG